MILKASLRLPIIKKKVPRLWLAIAAVAVIYYIKNQNDAVQDDIAQLVIGAPKAGQVSITITMTYSISYHTRINSLYVC